MQTPKTTTLLLLGGFLLLVGMVSGWGISQLSKDRAAYVNSAKVFSEFALTKELNAKLTNTQQSRKTILDSLELRVRHLNTLATSRGDQGLRDSLQYMAETLQLKSNQFAEDNQRQLETYNEEIWTQLNQYIQDYREAEGYTFLFGATGNGALMAAAPTKDLTEEIIAYVNLRYEGQ